MEKDEEESQERSSWSDLPPEIVASIIQRLEEDEPKDYCRLSMTCKSLLSTYKPSEIPLTPNTVISSSPPLLMFSTNKFRSIHGQTFVINDLERRYNAKLKCVNYGWYLMSEDFCDLFFYNPITKVRVDLPYLPDHCHPFVSCLFTAPPTSESCKVIGTTYYGELQVAILNSGDSDWTVHSKTFSGFRLSYDCNPIYTDDGKLHCLGTYGNLMTFNINTQKFSFGKKNKAMEKSKIFSPIANTYLVKKDSKQLYLVIMARDGSFLAVYQNKLIDNVFIKVDSIGDQIFYVSHQGCFCETSSTEGGGNRIYLARFHEKDVLYYSLHTKKFHTVAGYCTSHLVNKGYVSMWTKLEFDTACKETFQWEIYSDSDSDSTS